MRRTTGHSIVTTSTTVGVTTGLVIVDANAVRFGRPMPADDKRFDNKPGAYSRSPGEACWRAAASQSPGEAAALLRAAERHRGCSESGSLLPPRLWASWVLSQSLCG
jgi:hypothetical protein